MGVFFIESELFVQFMVDEELVAMFHPAVDMYVQGLRAILSSNPRNHKTLQTRLYAWWGRSLTIAVFNHFV